MQVALDNSSMMTSWELTIDGEQFRIKFQFSVQAIEFIDRLETRVSRLGRQTLNFMRTRSLN
jgi:hypothetical protein